MTQVLVVVLRNEYRHGLVWNYDLVVFLDGDDIEIEFYSWFKCFNDSGGCSYYHVDFFEYISPPSNSTDLVKTS